MRYLFKRRIYEAMPAGVQSLVASIPFGVWAGSAYRHVVHREQRLDRAARPDILAYQDKVLGAVLRFVTEQVPAYRSLRSIARRLSPREALQSFPLLDKETLQEHMADYLPRSFAKIPHYECTTGGTSGNQLRFYVDNDSQSVEIGFMHRLWKRVGYSSRCRKATFRGVEFRGLKENEFWQRNPIYNEMQFSPYHMNEKTMGRYLEALDVFRPEFLHGYPSAISLLANYMIHHGVDGRHWGIRAVLLGSESVTKEQRELLAMVFGARVFSWYGHSERVLLAGECEKEQVYHQLPDYGFLEILDESGNAVKEGECGELVGTGFLNTSLPLIRYRTGDRARRLGFLCSCGRCHDRMDQVEGRWAQEYVLGKGGSKISLAALNMHGQAWKSVVRYQYYQNQIGVLELRLQVGSEFGKEDEKELKAEFLARTGDELVVIPRVMEEIPLTSRGKLKRLIQEIRVEG